MSLSSLTLVVPEMHCIRCIQKLEQGIGKLPSVVRVRANLSLKQLNIQWHGKAHNATSLSSAVCALGFESHVKGSLDAEIHNNIMKSKSLLICLAVAGFAAANIMLLSISVWSGAEAETAELFGLISGIIAVPAVVVAGWPFYRSAIRALSSYQLNMDVPISLAVLLSLGMSLYEVLMGDGDVFFDASVMLLFFLLIGRVLDQVMRNKAASGVQSLAQMMSGQTNRILSNGETQTIEIADIEPGMRLKLLPGDVFPVDARLVSSHAVLDRSVVTGEIDPVLAKAGDVLEAGTINGSSVSDVKAVSGSEHSFLAHVLEMMEAAENGRGRYRRIADRFASIYAPVVHLLAFLTFLGWFVSTGDIKTSLVTAIAVLIITCPCALGLAVPVTHVVAANRLFGEGILMRDGSGLERLAQVDTAIFDKTGTLTKPEIVDGLLENLTGDQRGLIAALSAHSTHPISATLRTVLRFQVPNLVSKIREIPGKGVEGSWENKRIRLGLAEWVDQIAGTPLELEAAGCGFAVEGETAVTFKLVGKMRPEAKSAIQEISAESIDTLILSGDQKEHVESAAQQVGIDRVYSEQSPTKKVEFIRDSQAEGTLILMVGDGLNDAPSLGAAHVSMAPAKSADVSRNAADFVFTGGSLMAVPKALRIARQAAAIVRQNFSIALLYNCIAIPLAVAGHVTPLVAAIAMSLSSIAVVGNSMRLMISRTTSIPKRANRQTIGIRPENQIPKHATMER